MAITVTDGKGTPFGDVSVELTAAPRIAGAERRTRRDNSVFRDCVPARIDLRFSGEGVTAFEREVTLKAGEIAKLPITLRGARRHQRRRRRRRAGANAAAGSGGRSGGTTAARIADEAGRPAERNTKERREVLLSCSGNTRNMLLVLTDQQPTRNYEGAESTFYVISGQGAATVGKLESVISAGSFVAVPRSTPFSLARQGTATSCSAVYAQRRAV